MKSKIVLSSALTLLLGCAAFNASADPQNLLGENAPPTAATRTIVVNPDTQYVNVTGGDVVKFVVHNKDYVWNFDTAENISEFDLNTILPSNTLHHQVKIYVARNPLYTGA